MNALGFSPFHSDILSTGSEDESVKVYIYILVLDFSKIGHSCGTRRVEKSSKAMKSWVSMC